MNGPDLIGMIKHAEASGAIPQPIDGETLDNYRMRVAHAGAVIGVAFCQASAETSREGEAS